MIIYNTNIDFTLTKITQFLDFNKYFYIKNYILYFKKCKF